MNELPPLPAPGYPKSWGGLYSLAQMAAYARSAIEQDRDLRQAGQELVGTLHISHFRGLENTQFERVKDLPDGEYQLFTAPQPAPVPLTIVKDVRDGNFQEFQVNGHSGFIRVVARMEDDDEDLPLGKLVERFLLSTQEPLGPEFEQVLVAKDVKMGDYGLIVACEVEDIVTARLTARRPQTPVPLTVEQIPHMGATGDKFYDSVVDMWVNTTCRQDEIDFARVIEAAHNIQAVTP